jgi:hypothetical protein
MNMKGFNQLPESRPSLKTNKTILETLRELNITNNNTTMASSTSVTSAQQALSSATKNPIHYTKEDMKHTSKWKKYMKKIHDLIMEEFPNTCLIKKTNNSYLYESNTHHQQIAFECRFEGNPEHQKCTCVIYREENKIFHKTKKTPKRLYKEIIDFIDFQLSLQYTQSPGFVPLVFPHDYQNSFISSNADQILAFPELEKYDSDW